MNIYAEAIESLSAAYQRALDTGRRNMNAMSLATVNRHGHLSIRTVLLKELNDDGLVFLPMSEVVKAATRGMPSRICVCIGS